MTGLETALIAIGSLCVGSVGTFIVAEKRFVLRREFIAQIRGCRELGEANQSHLKEAIDELKDHICQIKKSSQENQKTLNIILSKLEIKEKRKD